MNVLAIDSATEVLALSATRGDSWASFSLCRGLQHSPALLPLVEKLLSELGMTASDLEMLVCSLGPGSFTGIRIGLATALGIGRGRDIPVVGVSTLDAIAWPWNAHDGDVFPVIDARKGKVYTARFRAGARHGDYLDISPGDLGALIGTAEQPVLVGPDAPTVRGLLGEAGRGVPVADSLDPRALLRLGMEQATLKSSHHAPLRPLYLRKSEAEAASGR